MKLLTILLLNKLKHKGGGITPTGTINITQNGTVDVTNYASADVNVVSDYNAKMITTHPSTSSYTCRSFVTEIPELDFAGFGSQSSSGFFDAFDNLETIKIKNMAGQTRTNNMFRGCAKLKNISGLNTTGTTNFGSMFFNCHDLINIPTLDLSVATNLGGLFSSCESLSNESLNKILGFLINATAYTGTKTLQYIGLSSAQATICTGLSNWPEAQNSGWTTGY